MEKTEKIWLNGKLVDWADAKVHVLAHALNYGTGVFEGIRVYQTPKGPAVFRLKDHVRRLVDGCKMMGFDLVFDGKTYTEKDVFEAIKDTVRANGDKVDYVKPCVFLSGEDVGLNPVHVPVSFAISCVHMGAYLGPGADAGAKLITSSWQRPDNLCGPAGAKVNGAYVASTLAKREAVSQGANEAPQTAESILEGITRNSVIQVARDMGYTVEETQISRFQLISSDEVWMTGTAAEIAPVTSVDGRPVGDGKIGKVSQAIHARFHDIVTGKVPEYDSWLDYVN